MLNNILTICWNMKFILSYPQIKLHNETHNTAQNWRTKLPNVLHNKIYRKIEFSLCFEKIKFTYSQSIQIQRFHQLGKHKLLYQKWNIIIAHFLVALFVALFVTFFVALFIAHFVALSVCTFYLKFCCISIWSCICK